MTTRPSLGQPRFISFEEVCTLHEVSVAQFGGATGLRDRGALESSLGMPQQAFGGEFAHSFPFGMAAAYAFHISKSHPFIDGNKRAAFTACVAFLRANGWDLAAPEDEAEQFMLDVVVGRTTKEQAGHWLEQRSHARPRLELRDFFNAIDVGSFVGAYQAVRPDSDGNSPPQFQATTEDVVSAMPLVQGLIDLNAQAVAGGDEASRLTTAAAILSLTALYRIAEDMGYEW